MSNHQNNVDPSSGSGPPDPDVKKKSGISVVWLIPIITALVGGWLIYKTLSEKGPQISITFQTAEGIEAGKTKIKYKDIEIGVVESVRFSEDFSHVILSAAMDKDAEAFLKRGTRFWVAKPQLSLRGVSNLSTLVSGVYIEIEPGQGAPQKHFVGLDDPPVVRADVAGTKIVLLTKNLGSIDIGSPIFYQGIQAGEIMGWELGTDRKSILIHAFIKAPYNELLRSNSRFWNVSGLNISVDSQGVEVRTESVTSLLYGGIAFDTPASYEPIKEKVDGLVFTLHESYESIQERAFTKKITFILFFDGSVRGLNVGAPVEFKGIKVGSVVDVRLEFDSKTTTFRIPVLIEMEPERVIEKGGDEDASPYQALQTLVDRGLRAQLQTGSLLTGQLFVELDMHPDTPIRLIADKRIPYPELPTIPASLEQITTSVKGILTKIEKMDLDKIGAELLVTLKGASTMVQDANQLVKDVNVLVTQKEIRNAIANLNDSIEIFKDMLGKIDRRIEPIAVNVEKTIAAGHQALDKVQDTLGLFDNVLEPDAPLQYRVIELTEELAETARSIRILVDLLERNPNSLIFGKDSGGE